MKKYLLDSSALLALRDNEDGADTVENLLINEKCYGCFITLMEVLYRVWKDEGEICGWLAYEQLHSIPINWIHESKELLEKAAEIKARYSLSLADAWIAASADLQNAILVHKDPEFKLLKCPQLELPYKTSL